MALSQVAQAYIGRRIDDLDDVLAPIKQLERYGYREPVTAIAVTDGFKIGTVLIGDLIGDSAPIDEHPDTDAVSRLIRLKRPTPQEAGINDVKMTDGTLVA